jgi:hypothetical protein
MATATVSTPAPIPVMDEWFNDLIATLRTHQLELETGTATESVKSLYDIIFGKDKLAFTHLVRANTTRDFVTKIIFDYLKEITNLPVLNLAFNHTNSHVLVWAEIDDDISERELILAEARINAKYHQYGFAISTTIIEKGDNLDIPSQYIPFKQTEVAEF